MLSTCVVGGTLSPGHDDLVVVHNLEAVGVLGLGHRGQRHERLPVRGALDRIVGGAGLVESAAHYQAPRGAVVVTHAVARGEHGARFGPELFRRIVLWNYSGVIL
jgi:hypothetical protein